MGIVVEEIECHADGLIERTLCIVSMRINSFHETSRTIKVKR
jgi:hypothetical protein